MTGGETNDTNGSQVVLLESKARVARGHLLQTVDALMSRRNKMASSIKRVKQAFHMLPLALTGFGALLALGVGTAALRDPTRRTHGSRERRAGTAKTLIVVGAALFAGLLAGFGAARRHD